ncbi:HAD-IA family hydrolase [Candidatus Dojkabacteria bacterium]|nr:HAD-IA family hydrolase [Candidatus Dojkabacteria bacterium]
MIKVITFDLDGVYFPNGKKNFINTLVKLGVEESRVKDVFANSPQMNMEYKLGKVTDEQFWSWAAKEWNLNMTWQKLVKVLIDSYDVDTKIVEVINKARAKGYMTAICTSNFPARIKGLQNKFGFLDNFDIKVISYEVGYNKPYVEIFKKLIEYSKVKPEEIVFADDNLESVTNSQACGITTFQYETFDKYLEQLVSVGVKL